MADFTYVQELREASGDALHHDNVYKFPEVKVSTFKGTVQLSGFVNQTEQKDRAENLAKGTPGVREVVNNITVKE